MDADKKLNLTTRYVLIFGVLLLAANILLGLVLLRQSRTALQSMLEKNMLDITNSAAGLMDGDALGAVTAEDVGGEFCSSVIRTLNVFRERVEVEYIYAVRQVGENQFVFMIDPDPVDPGQFGEAIAATWALSQAARGIAAADSAPQTDRWGDFYSAYSPVFDSSGAVAGIIGADFAAAWYELQLHGLSVSVLVVSTLTVLIGAAVILLITHRTQKRFRSLSGELSVLSSDVDELTDVITSNPGYAESMALFGDLPARPAETDARTDEIGALSDRIRFMERSVKRYLEYEHAQASTDALTGVGNTAAYLERVRELQAAYTVAVFDIDLLKKVNDEYGHACGDMIIRGAAAVISRVFGKSCVFRIGGDEFLAIAPQMTEEEAVEQLARVEAAAAEFTMPDKQCDGRLSLSGGATVWRPGREGNFREVFIRADEAMYQRKGEHHRRSRSSHAAE